MRFSFLELRVLGIFKRLFSTTDQQPAYQQLLLFGDSSRTFISPMKEKSLNFLKRAGPGGESCFPP